MSTKIATIIAVVAILAVGGYFGYQSINKSNSTQTPTQDTTSNETNTNQENQNVTPDTTQQQPQASENLDSVDVKFETSEGDFVVTLDGKAAPKTVKNFVEKVKAGFYDGKKFYRVENQDPSFTLIQGGDPTSTSSVTIPAEIGLKHTKGAIAMARTNNPAKASSDTEIYITAGAIPQLDGNYTVFGYVSSGMNSVEKLAATPTEPYGGISIPTKELTMKKVTVVEKE